jgi:hypothetical protein
MPKYIKYHMATGAVSHLCKHPSYQTSVEAELPLDLHFRQYSYKNFFGCMSTLRRYTM